MAFFCILQFQEKVSSCQTEGFKCASRNDDQYKLFKRKLWTTDKHVEIKLEVNISPSLTLTLCHV